MGLSNIFQRGFSPSKYFGFLNLTRQYLRFLSSQGISWPNYGTLLTWDNFFRYVRGNLYPRNLAVYYPNDSTALYLDGSSNVILWEDRSGNSATNCLVLNGVAGNYASFAALTAFGTGDFTLSIKAFVASLAATQTLIGSNTNGVCLNINTDGTFVSSLENVGNNAASTGTTTALALHTFSYTRSGTTGTYYIDGVAAGTITDTRNYSVGITTFGASGAINKYFNGNIFSARVYSVALDATAIAFDAAGSVQANCIFNSNIAVVTKLATSFTESSVNAATVTINTSGDTGARICGARDLYQGTAANRPAYTATVGRNRLFMTFDGSNDYLKAASFSLVVPESVYFVGSQISWTSFDQIYGGNAPGGMDLWQRAASPALSMYNGGTQLENTTFPLATKMVVTSIFNNTASVLRLNRDTPVAGSATSAGGANGFILAANPNGIVNLGNITAFEIAIYAEAHNAVTQNNIIGFFANRYGISL